MRRIIYHLKRQFMYQFLNCRGCNGLFGYLLMSMVSGLMLFSFDTAYAGGGDLSSAVYSAVIEDVVVSDSVVSDFTTDKRGRGKVRQRSNKQAGGRDELRSSEVVPSESGVVTSGPAPAAAIAGHSKVQAPAPEPAQAPQEDVGTLAREWPPVVLSHYFGVKGGYGMGSGRFEPTRENLSHMGLINGGLVYIFDVPAQKYVGAIQIELGWMQKGYSYLTYKESVDVISRDYNVIEIPVLWQPYFPLSRRNASRFFINAGPYVSYAISSTFRNYNKDTGVTASAGDYVYNSQKDNRWEYGIAAGAGFRIFMGKRLSFMAEFRYNIAMSDTFKGLDKYPSNGFFRSPIDQMNISVGLIYKIN